MPRQPIPVNSAKAVVTGTFGPATWANILYFQVITAATGGEADTANDVAEGALDLYNKLGYSHFSSEWTVQTSKVLYRASSADYVRALTIADATGSADGPAQDAQVSYLINWLTGDVRRGGKPRTYIPGVPLAACADSANLTTDFLGAMNSGISDWQAELADGSLTNGSIIALVEMSFVSAGVDESPPFAYPVTGGRVNPVVATQRRRIDRLRGL